MDWSAVDNPGGPGQRQRTNLELKNARKDLGWSGESTVRQLLKNDGTINAVTVCFSDIEGRFHMLDYDKEFLLKASDNLTFDGSSIRGFTAQHESDLKLSIDWGACYFLDPDLFGRKAFIFGEIQDAQGELYTADIRGKLKLFLTNFKLQVHVAAEIEGFLFQSQEAEQKYQGPRSFQGVTSGGYFNTLPQSLLRQFVDEVAKVQREAGFENEKDHPEVGPSQFEINWSYTDALIAADQIQLYKMICRQVAARRQSTACFLPKPVVGINGNGMHINISLSEDDKNLFYGTEPENLSQSAWDFLHGILDKAEDICLILNSSVNAYRRLDPHFEAPNEIKASAEDRGAMVRIPLANERSARIEVRTVAPDANPYLAIYVILQAGLSEREPSSKVISQHLPSNIDQAMHLFRESTLMRDCLGPDVHSKFLRWKQEAADRCPRKLGDSIKPAEILYHHEVTNQQLWNQF